MTGIIYIKYGDFRRAVGRKSNVKTFLFMSGTEDTITQRDPDKVEVITYQEVSYSILIPML